jgi:hypothetical protein
VIAQLAAVALAATGPAPGAPGAAAQWTEGDNDGSRAHDLGAATPSTALDLVMRGFLIVRRSFRWSASAPRARAVRFMAVGSGA